MNNARFPPHIFSIFYKTITAHLAVTKPVAVDIPLSYPAGCVLPAAGTHSSCTPPSAPSSFWPDHSLPFQSHIASPHRI